MRSVVLFAVVAMMSLSAGAEVVAGHDLKNAEGLVQDMSTKLNRGVVNLLTGWGEIPRQVILSGREKSWWTALPIGLPAGAIMAVVRTATGAFETVCFAVPINDSYGPILHPAFVWQKADE